MDLEWPPWSTPDCQGVRVHLKQSHTPEWDISIRVINYSYWPHYMPDKHIFRNSRWLPLGYNIDSQLTTTAYRGAYIVRILSILIVSIVVSDLPWNMVLINTFQDDVGLDLKFPVAWERFLDRDTSLAGKSLNVDIRYVLCLLRTERWVDE